MKKLFAVVLALAMLLTGLAVAENIESVIPTPVPTPEPTPEPTPDPAEVVRQALIERLLGTWYLNAFELDGARFAPETFGAELAMTLNEDGTVTADYGDTQDGGEGEWSVEAERVTIAIDGSANEFFLNEEDVLSAAIEGGSMIFGRERAEAEAFEPSAPVEAAEEDFAGEWRAFEIGVDDAFYDVALFGQSITATIEDTVITIAGYVFTGLSVQAEYVDGELRFTGADDEGGMFDGIAAQLLEDGNLCLKLSAGEMGAFTLIMNRVEENS